MNEGNGSMSWKDNIERLLANEFIQTFIFIIINLIFFSKFSILLLISKYFKMPIKVTFTDGIAILTVFVLATGVIYYLGVYKERQEKYLYTNFPFKFKEKSVMMGSIFIATIIFTFVLSESIKPLDIEYLHAILIMVIFFSVLTPFFIRIPTKSEDISFLKWKSYLKNGEYHLTIYITIYIVAYLLLVPFTESLIFNLFYILIISSFVIFFGYETEKHSHKNKSLTLEMINSNEPIENLELFDTTDIDYRFKNSKGNEFIVPIGQVKKIIYKSAKEDTKVKVMELGNKMKDKEEIRRFAENEFKNDLNKTYEQLGIDGYDEIFQENRNLPNNTNEQIRLLTLDNENMKHAMKRMFAFSAKTGLENIKTQEWIKWLTFLIVFLTIIIIIKK